MFSEEERAKDLDPHSGFWSKAVPIRFETDNQGRSRPGLEIVVWSRWTSEHLYFLFVNHFLSLHVNPQPDLSAETYGLWSWDVAEVFLGANPSERHRYREFEISPLGEWVDVDVDLSSTSS